MTSSISPLSRAPPTANNGSMHSHQRLTSEPHSYNIQAKLRNGILSIFVHDTQTNCQWRQEFTQISFPSHKLYHVAKALIMAIQTMIESAKNHKLPPTNEPKPISILVYNQWCYLTIQNTQYPSFALRPIQPQQQQPQPQQQSTAKSTSLSSSRSSKYTKANLSRLSFPTRPLPPLPVAHKMSVKTAEQHSYNRSVLQQQSQQKMSNYNPHHYGHSHSMYIPSAQSTTNSSKGSHHIGHKSVPHIIEDDDDSFNSSSDVSDYEDEMINSEDTDSDSFKYQRMHSNDTSMDSMMDNTGSLDSLFTNSGHNNNNNNNGNGLSLAHSSLTSTHSHTNGSNHLFSPIANNKKMKIFNVSMDDDDDDDMGTDNDDLSDNEYESVSPMNGFRANTRWIGNKMQRHYEKKKNVKRELVICLNGSVIDDLEHHAIEQMIAEEEYYDEEEDQTPDYYDPNYLGVQPYYDD